MIRVKQTKDVLIECNKNFATIAFNCLLNDSKKTLLVSETCVEDRNKNTIKA